jgi:hypothetical protein
VLVSATTALIVGQFAALITFFAFPVIQYSLLKRVSRREGLPELWYLPDYGFRVVIRNLPRKRTLTDVKYRAFVRRLVPPSGGASVATLDDKLLLSRTDFFVFPGVDETILCFRLEAPGDEITAVNLVQTNKLGEPVGSIPLNEMDRLICDYTATIENYFNFNVRVAKRVELRSETLMEIWRAVRDENREGQHSFDRVRHVG